MAQAIAGKLLIRRWNSEDVTGISDDYATSFSNTVFGFLEEQEELPNNESRSRDWGEEEDEEENPISIEENKKFWETQNQLLQATLYRTSSLETKVRRATKDALREINRLSVHCTCGNPVARGCQNCLQREVSVRLQNEGYNCTICKSKWKTSQDIPAGEHSYLEVVENTSQKGEVRVVIELNFRAEFEMARANEDYNQLINRLPEVYVGKSERLKALIKILCSSAKQSMKEKKMHLGPWRKHKYMQCKWVGTCESTTPAPLPVIGFVDRTARPRASMLTCDLLDAMPVLHRTAVRV